MPLVQRSTGEDRDERGRHRRLIAAVIKRAKRRLTHRLNCSDDRGLRPARQASFNEKYPVCDEWSEYSGGNWGEHTTAGRSPTSRYFGSYRGPPIMPLARMPSFELDHCVGGVSNVGRHEFQRH